MDIDPQKYAASVRQLLNEDPKRYRNFGVYWFLVKELLKRYYSREEMPILGDYRDEAVVAAMPPAASLAEALQAAAEEYGRNAVYNLGRAQVTSEDGEEITIFDSDIGL